jgi:hypothetical protein
MSTAGGLAYVGLLLSLAGLLTFGAVMFSRALQPGAAPLLQQPAPATTIPAGGA